MELRKYEGKNVRLIDVDGDGFIGYASDYIFADDNAPEEVESIVLSHPTRDDGYVYDTSVEFTAHEIRSIEIIE